MPHTLMQEHPAEVHRNQLFGVYVALMSVMMVVAWFVIIWLRWSAARFGVLRSVWHPSLFVFAVYMIVLSSMVVVASS